MQRPQKYVAVTEVAEETHMLSSQDRQHGANENLNSNSISNHALSRYDRDLETDDDFVDDEGDPTPLADEDELHTKLTLEVDGISRLNTALDFQNRQSRFCLIRCMCGSRNSRIISVWFFTFLIFGVVEIIGSLKANSLSMMGDAVLMILDAVTYGANIYADYECSKHTRVGDDMFKTKTHFAASLFSLLVILIVEAYVITDAIFRIMAPSSSEDVNATIMFVLTGINAVLDVIGAVMICHEHRCCCDWKRLRTDVNMFSATLHLVSDCFRTLAVIVAAMLIRFDSINIDGDKADAGTSLVVSGLICFGAMILAKEVHTLGSKIFAKNDLSNRSDNDPKA